MPGFLWGFTVWARLLSLAARRAPVASTPASSPAGSLWGAALSGALVGINHQVWSKDSPITGKLQGFSGSSQEPGQSSQILNHPPAKLGVAQPVTASRPSPSPPRRGAGSPASCLASSSLMSPRSSLWPRTVWPLAQALVLLSAQHWTYSLASCLCEPFPGEAVNRRVPRSNSQRLLTRRLAPSSAEPGDQGRSASAVREPAPGPSLKSSGWGCEEATALQATLDTWPPRSRVLLGPVISTVGPPGVTPSGQRETDACFSVNALPA